MKNTKRNPDFINLKHKISSCKTPEKLELLRQIVLKFNKDNKTDGPELMALFLEREQDLSVDHKNDMEFEKRNGHRDLEEDSQESLHHRYEGAEIDSALNQKMNRFHSTY